MAMIDQYLEELKLPSILANYAKDSYEGYLYKLAEQEVLSRMDRALQVRLKKAQFPGLKTVDGFNFANLENLDKKRVMSLLSGDYLQHAENVLALGNSGTGKTHLAIALGVAACQNGHNVLFRTAAQLVHELIEAHDAKRLLSLQKKLKSYKLLIIDEVGYVPFSKTGAELLFEVFSSSYEQSSLVVTSNLPFEEWPQVFGCSRLTGALLDRLTHHVHILEMNGPSYRLVDKQQPSKGAVTVDSIPTQKAKVAKKS
jgi:DNA replication protein DnaC